MIRIFIASQIEIHKRFLAASCRKLQFEVISMTGEKSVVSEVEKAVPDLVFIDESLAGTGGRVLIDKLKNLKGLEDLFIIYIAASMDLSSIAFKLGADAFLPIPFSQSKFESVLRNIMNIPKKILLVSSQESTVSDLKEELTKLRFDLYYTTDGDKCMTTVHKIFPDLVIAEYNLEDISGVELCKKIKTANLSSHIPVIILFKGSKADVIEECFYAGAHDVLLAPYNNTENLDRITAIVTPPVKGRKEKALVIDDSPMVRGLITRMFKQLGFMVTAAENGLEGLRAARKTRPDIITCDYDMPIMNGWDFCMEAKQEEEIDAPVIMVSARGTDIDKKKGQVLGVVEYLSKPFKEEDLKRAVARAIAENKRRKEREAISKYIASDVLANVTDVIEGVKNRDPEEKEITVLFSDICSFTPKCERLNPRSVVKLLNSYFDVMIKILQHNQAIVDKLIGDAIVARFNCGNPGEDALHAVTAAEEMLAALREFNLSSLEPVEIRIGINTGTLILGNIGCESFRLDYTMIGDTVNVGQRLESAAPHMGCLIAESTYLLVKDIVEVGSGLELTLKGKKRVVMAYPLLKVHKQE